jgi:hypothetical protein
MLAGVARPDPLVELFDEVRSADAGAARARQRSMERQASEEATLVGTLVDLAERRAQVSLRTTAGRTCHGSVVAVSGDFVVVRAEAGRDHCVRLRAVASIRPQHGERHGVAVGGRAAPLDLNLVEVLAGLAPDHPRVALVVDGGELVSGTLLAAGADVVTVGREGDPDLVTYVAAAALGEAVIERR